MQKSKEKQKKFLGTVPKKCQLVETFWDCPEISKTNNNGITLIALIITIIVMLILVGVTINVALNGGLFTNARQATKQTQIEMDREQLLTSVVAALDENLQIPNAETLQNNLPSGWSVTGEDAGPFTATSPNGNVFTVDKDGTITSQNGGTQTPGGGDEPEDPTVTLPAGWTETTKPAEWDNENVIAITDGTNTVPLPAGYEISTVDGEHTVEEGLVIKDSIGNEFVWIPVTSDFTTTYSSGTNYSEPTEVTSNYSASGAPYDSQATLDYLYGTSYYNYSQDFAYSKHYSEMVESVNKYNGFYIGRYETTISGSDIGSKYNTTVLTVNKTIPQTNNKACNWWGLYYAQRNSSVTGNNSYLQTNMIWGQQWDAMISCFNSNSKDYSAWGNSTQGAVVKSGQSTNSSGAKDEIYNIYDLRINGYDWTAEAYSTDSRTIRGGKYNDDRSASDRYGFFIDPTYGSSGDSSRLTLYIR